MISDASKKKNPREWDLFCIVVGNIMRAYMRFLNRLNSLRAISSFVPWLTWSHLLVT